MWSIFDSKKGNSIVYKCIHANTTFYIMVYVCFFSSEATRQFTLYVRPPIRVLMLWRKCKITQLLLKTDGYKDSLWWASRRWFTRSIRLTAIKQKFKRLRDFLYLFMTMNICSRIHIVRLSIHITLPMDVIILDIYSGLFLFSVQSRSLTRSFYIFFVMNKFYTF